MHVNKTSDLLLCVLQLQAYSKRYHYCTVVSAVVTCRIVGFFFFKLAIGATVKRLLYHQEITSSR